MLRDNMVLLSPLLGCYRLSAVLPLQRLVYLALLLCVAAFSHNGLGWDAATVEELESVDMSSVESCPAHALDAD